MRNASPNYAWGCADGCSFTVDTAVSVIEDIAEFEKWLANPDGVALVAESELSDVSHRLSAFRQGTPNSTFAVRGAKCRA
jgi:hypothetical protein